MIKRIGIFLFTNFLVTLALGAVMFVLVRFLGIDIGAYGSPTGIMSMMFFCGIFGMGGAMLSLFMSKTMAKKAYRLTMIGSDMQDSGLRSVHQMIVRLAKEAGLPRTPEVGIYRSPDPNAFATGPSKSDALVAFSTGLLEGMNAQEVEAVAAHEISHIANGDMVTTTLLTGIANTFVMFLATIAAALIDNFLRGNDEEGEGGGLGMMGYFMVRMLLQSVFMFLANIAIAAFSRWREFRADAGAAKLTTPQAMASALNRLKNFTQIPVKNDGLLSSKISSGGLRTLFSTHPPLDERIKRLVG